ncbi:SprT family zinc-dependent metalloprotease [Urbifossiella limnaea]|uniref:SprT-like family protein n=1 Tax=Urbifossiella limnaea TaxID=2528023 RepID=A0A517XQ89_9BACT|nr:SprT-like domain-containing protein [Urbifossiella limnaea]QDU19670.1 SprT-like family protein [Urbifossiella limnaea]
MTAVTDSDFTILWNAAGSLAAVVSGVSDGSPRPVPRWTVLARATALRQAGVSLREHPDERPPASLLTRAKELAAAVMTQHGLTNWQFAFNTNKRRAGVCRYPVRGRPGRIELSKHYVLRNPESEVRDTILHEIAHALVGHGHGHDEVWRAKCVEVGARPERCYGEEVEMPKGRWRATCGGCGREHDRHRRPKRMTGWHCRKCGKERGALLWKATG